MKFALHILATLVIAFCVATGSGYAQSTVNLTANASIENNSPELDLVILKITDGDPDENPWTNSQDVTGTGTLGFGTLTHTFDNGDDAGSWFSDTFFCVVIFTQPFGTPYRIYSSCQGLQGTQGQGLLPSGSFGVAPAYSSDDEFQWPGGSAPQGSMPAGDSLGSEGSAVAQNKVVYNGNSGQARIIRAYYSLPPKTAGGGDPFPGHTSIPLDQAPGTYSGQVTLTIAQ